MMIPSAWIARSRTVVDGVPEGGETLIHCLAGLSRSGRAPRVVVRSLTHTGDRNWSVRPTAAQPADSPAASKTAVTDDWVGKMGYRPVWSNADFKILERAEAGSAPSGEAAPARE